LVHLIAILFLNTEHKKQILTGKNSFFLYRKKIINKLLMKTKKVTFMQKNIDRVHLSQFDAKHV